MSVMLSFAHYRMVQGCKSGNRSARACALLQQVSMSDGLLAKFCLNTILYTITVGPMPGIVQCSSPGSLVQ